MSSILNIFTSNLGSEIFRILLKQSNFSFYYRTIQRSYRTLSLWASRVLIRHQPHHGRFSFILYPTTHHLHPRHLNSHSITRINPYGSPAPLLRDVGPITNVTSKRTTSDPSRTRPSPLQRDVGGSWSIDGGVGDGEMRGGTQELGGPSSASRKRSTTFIVVRFRLSFSFCPHPPLTPIRPTQHPPPTSPPLRRLCNGLPRHRFTNAPASAEQLHLPLPPFRRDVGCSSSL